MGGYAKRDSRRSRLLAPTKRQRHYYRKQWNEFAPGETPKAKSAAAVDKVDPIFEKYLNLGGSPIRFRKAR